MLKLIKLVRLQNKFDAAWEYAFPPETDRNLEHLAYVLFDDRQGFHLAKIDAWSNTVELIPNGTSSRWKLRFSYIKSVGSHSTDLLKSCDKPLSPNEISDVERFVKSGVPRPIDKHEFEHPVSLDLDQGRAAVARYYHLDASQIEVTIKSAS